MEPIKTDTLTDRVYNILRSSILTNALQPHEELSIDTLAQQLGVSATPVREALTRLSTDGLVDREPNRKAKVIGISENQLDAVFGARELIETHAFVAMAARSRSDRAVIDELRELRGMVDAIQGRLSEPVPPDVYQMYVEVDRRLQDIVARKASNEILTGFLMTLNDYSLRIRSFAETSRQVRLVHVMREVCEEHRSILDAMDGGDPPTIERAVRDHLAKSRARTLDALCRAGIIGGR